MGRLSIFAAQAAQEAIDDAKLNGEIVSSGRTGCVIGSTMGSACSLYEAYKTIVPNEDMTNLGSTRFFEVVSHTAAMNVAQHVGVSGAVISPNSACASGLQAIGLGYDLIRLGRQDVVLCGGAEELHSTVAGIFDVLLATSTGYNDRPEMTPRPFDADRDGLVCGEGAGIVVLEDLEHAKRRGAGVCAEIVGYYTCGSGEHVSQSSSEAILRCMRGALDEAGVEPGDVDYVNAHATATLQGDREEAKALAGLFGDKVPVSSLKGHIGHTLGASGALELIASLLMMREGVIYPTLNLERVDPECAGLDHVTTPERWRIRLLMKNCFAFGGINAALVCRDVDSSIGSSD